MEMDDTLPAALKESLIAGLKVDPEVAATARREEAQKYMGYTPQERAQLDQNIADLKAFDERMYDPEKMKREALIAFMLGGGGKETAAGALGAGGRTLMAHEKGQETRQRSALQERQKQMEDLIDKTQNIRTSAYGEGTTALERASMTQHQATESATSRVRGMLDAMSNNASLRSAENIAAVNAEINARANELQGEANRLKQAGMDQARKKELELKVADSLAEVDKLERMEIENNMPLQNLWAEHANERDSKDRAEIKAKIDAIMLQIESKYRTSRERFRAILEGETGNDSAGMSIVGTRPAGV